MKPFHEHDCESCLHLLSTEYGKWKIDVHFCPEQSLGGSVIMRLSSDPADYWSNALDILHSSSRSLAYWSHVMRTVVERAGCTTPEMQNAFGVWAHSGSWPHMLRLPQSVDPEDRVQLTVLRCSILSLAREVRSKKEG